MKAIIFHGAYIKREFATIEKAIKWMDDIYEVERHDEMCVNYHEFTFTGLIDNVAYFEANIIF